MPSKFDQLREGHAVEIEPGLSGMLNRKNRTLELSSGEVLNVGHNKNFFPSNEKDVNLSKQREYAEKKAKGAGGEFFHQYTSAGIPGSISDIGAYLTQSGDEYINRKQAQNEVSERISQESPYISGAATGANIATDIALTHGMSALKAAPLLTAGSAGSKLLTNPGEVATDSLIAAGGGYILDKATGGLGRIASRRGASRALPAEQESVRNANALGQQATNETNIAQNQKFNALKQNVKSNNESLLKQHEIDLNTRQNTIIQEKNAYEQAKIQRDNEVMRLKNKFEMEKNTRAQTALQSESEYKAAKALADQENKRMAEKFKFDQAQHEKALKELPEMQKKAQQEYSENVIKNAEGISKAFPKDAKIYSSEFAVPTFIDESIQKSGLAGSREANQASKILKSIFPDGEIFTGNELSTRYRALEGAIQKSNPEVKQILNQFKTHMGDRLPMILADNMAYNRVIPSLKKQVEKEVSSILDSMGIAETGIASRSYLKSRANSNINQLFRALTPQEFIQKMQNGEIRQQILKGVINPNDFSSGLGALKAGKKGMNISSDDLQRLGINVSNPPQDKYNQFSNLFMGKLDNALAKAELKMIATDVDAATKLGGKVKKTFGTAEPVVLPSAPIASEPMALPNPPSELPPINPPQFPPNINAPQIPSLPIKPNLMNEPTAPMAQSFNPQPEPNLAPANGMAERMGDVLEKPLLESGGKGQLNNLMKIGGLKYLLGKAALPAEAAYLGMKGLTSPTAAGEVARMSFKQGGIEAILSWAQKYPSFHDGIIENPQERRSLTKEIEDDSDIPGEQKAVLQSKINRGRPLQERL